MNTSIKLMEYHIWICDLITLRIQGQVTLKSMYKYHKILMYLLTIQFYILYIIIHIILEYFFSDFLSGI